MLINIFATIGMITVASMLICLVVVRKEYNNFKHYNNEVTKLDLSEFLKSHNIECNDNILSKIVEFIKLNNLD